MTEILVVETVFDFKIAHFSSERHEKVVETE